MDGLGENIKKLLLAGVGAVAVSAEKSKEILDEMVKKGELTVEQGKILNEELKHNIKKTVKENVNVSIKPSTPDEIGEALKKFTPEQLEQLKGKIQDIMENSKDEESDEESEEEAEEVEEVEEEAEEKID